MSRRLGSRSTFLSQGGEMDNVEQEIVTSSVVLNPDTLEHASHIPTQPQSSRNTRKRRPTGAARVSPKRTRSRTNAITNATINANAITNVPLHPSTTSRIVLRHPSPSGQTIASSDSPEGSWVLQSSSSNRDEHSVDANIQFFFSVPGTEDRSRHTEDRNGIEDRNRHAEDRNRQAQIEQDERLARTLHEEINRPEEPSDADADEIQFIQMEESSTQTGEEGTSRRTAWPRNLVGLTVPQAAVEAMRSRQRRGQGTFRTFEMGSRMRVLLEIGDADDVASYERLVDLVEQLGDAKHGMSKEEIEVIPTELFNAGMETESCVVCISEFRLREKMRILPCTHRFHKKCIDKWLTSKSTCPICRCSPRPSST